MVDRSRRDVLRGAAVGAAATASVGLWAAAPDASARSVPTRCTATGMHRLGATGSSAGDRCVVVADVHGPNGMRGTFRADVVRLHAHGQPTHDGASTLEHHVFAFADGTLTGTGTLDLHGHGTFAVTGGTGAYLQAQGSYVAVVRRPDLGGDGTAHFEFALRKATS